MVLVFCGVEEGVGCGPCVHWGWEEWDMVPVFIGVGRSRMWSLCSLGLEEEWVVVLVFHGVGKGVGCGYDLWHQKRSGVWSC